ncbi:hypothetical protein [Goodfellowiella coeruleoviolacea]|uniref:Uncharacterized protein n=1 Tax=Goodfellowiella coeruleoviolacea TaxID=334858 RepID=A0AAE3KFY8_9PSEU|nr:hypothetical protein [Goodfellowiella coeruleoviolacea]MCP2164914.1 hypothetical protein [Goodfellowiella coeruleoviolacea]
MTFPYDNAKLQALLADVDSALANVDRTAAEASQVQSRSSGLSEKDIAEIERVARGPGAPKELKDLQRRVEAGELSWSDIAAGRVLDDAGVRDAFATGLPNLRRAYVAIEEGQDIDEIIESGQPRRGRPSGDDDDEPPTFLERV